MVRLFLFYLLLLNARIQYLEATNSEISASYIRTKK